MANSKVFHGEFYKSEMNKLLTSPGHQGQYAEFVKRLEGGQKIQVFMEADDGSGTLIQLAKIHACCRQLAKDLGNTFEEMKFEIKKKAGLCFITDFKGEKVLYCKSFADCSVEDLGLAIQAIIELGDFTGSNYR